MSEEQKPAPRREVFSQNEKYEKPAEKASHSVGRDSANDVKPADTVPQESNPVGTDEQSTPQSADGNGQTESAGVDSNGPKSDGQEQAPQQPSEEPA